MLFPPFFNRFFFLCTCSARNKNSLGIWRTYFSLNRATHLEAWTFRMLLQMRGPSERGSACWLSPGLSAAGGGVPPLCPSLVLCPCGTCAPMTAHRVWLFGNVLSLLLSGVDLFYKTCAIHRACWAFGRRRSPGSQRPASVLLTFSPQGGGRGRTWIPRESSLVLFSPKEMNLEGGLRTAASASPLGYLKGRPDLVNTQTAPAWLDPGS